MIWDFQSVNCHGESLCGDSVLCERTTDGLLWVHSDGMGHGVKANVLSELTCEIVMSEWRGVDSIQKVMEMLALRLPICSVRGLGYSTFALVEYAERGAREGEAKVWVVEYDTPGVLYLRDGVLCGLEQVAYRTVRWKSEERQVRIGHFSPRVGDWLVSVSDGVTQSGVGGGTFPFGWGALSFGTFVEGIVQMGGDRLTPEGLCDRVVNAALEREGYYAHDDISVLAVRF